MKTAKQSLVILAAALITAGFSAPSPASVSLNYQTVAQSYSVQSPENDGSYDDIWSVLQSLIF